jgi:hypothetical protein
MPAMAVAKPPSSEEWEFSAFPPERRSYLETDPSFEEIAQRVEDEAVCEFAEFDPLRETTRLAPRGTWRSWFKIRVHCSTSDLFFNGRDGLRGRYWQDPAAGLAATDHVLCLLKGRLLNYVSTHPMVSEPTASEHLIYRSLDARSAKIWAHEEKSEIFDGPLFVKRWSISTTEKNWRWSPARPLLDIKGAFFTPDHREHIVKPHRDCEIHKYGFS